MESVTFKVTGSQRDLRAALKEELSFVREAALSPGGICGVIHLLAQQGPLALALCICLSVRSWPTPGWQGSWSHPANTSKKTRTVTT